MSSVKICLPLIFPLAKKSSPHLRIGNWSAAAAVLQPWHFYTWKEYKLKIQTEGKIFLRRLLYCGTNPNFCHEEPKSQNILAKIFSTLNQLFQIVMLTCAISIQYANQVSWHQRKISKGWFFVSDSAGLQIELAMLCQSDTCENIQNKLLHVTLFWLSFFWAFFELVLYFETEMNLSDPILN